ncbi:MAG: hypothetical protein ACRYF3_01690 [Janthinobacterium lividum]
MEPPLRALRLNTMLRRRDLLISLTTAGVLAACADQTGAAPTDPVPGWPGDLPTTSATWQELPVPPMNPRRGPTLTWTGTELLVTGGTGPVVGPTSSCPPNADCAGPPTEPVEDSGSYDPVTATWRRFPTANLFHHGTTWTGRLLTDGYSWFDPVTGESGLAPETDLLVYAPAWWSGTEVLCVGTDGSGQPVPHTLWAWNPVTNATRTSRVPGPDSGETCFTVRAGDELLVGLTQVPDGHAGTGVFAYELAGDRWHEVPPSQDTAAFPTVPFDGWDGSRLIGIDRGAGNTPRLDRVDPTDGARTSLELPQALRGGEWAENVVVGPGRVAVGVGGRYAVLDGAAWTALPELPDVVDGDSLIAVWAGDRLIVWEDSGKHTGWLIQPA